jgi:hypothetical protein
MLNDFHKTDCRCKLCYDPILLRTKVIDDNGDTHIEVTAHHECPPISESAARKGKPLFSGCLMYFPDALLAVAEHSKKANDKHNPGEPLHWSKDKSKDHADCVARHLLDVGPAWDDTDPEFGSYHATALAWRALALLQTVLDRKKAAK